MKNVYTILEAGSILRPGKSLAIQKAAVYNALAKKRIKEVKVETVIAVVGGQNVMITLDRPIRLLDGASVRAASLRKHKGTPVTVKTEEGVLNFESITEAMKETGFSYYKLKNLVL